MGGVDVVGVDISGRHRESGEYLMVAAAVAATIGSSRLIDIHGIGFATSHAEPSLLNTLDVIVRAVNDLPERPNGLIIAERGEFYGEPVETISVSFEEDFKYVESIAERKTVKTAHHAAYAARKLLL